MRLNYQLLDATEQDVEMVMEAEKEILEIENREIAGNNQIILEAIRNREIKIVANKNEKIGFLWAKTNYSVPYFDNVFFIKLTYLKKNYRKFFYPFILQAIKDFAKQSGYSEVFGDVFHSNEESFKVHSKLAEPVFTVFRAKL